MKHITEIVNRSNDLTVAFSWILHAQHARQDMGEGHYQIGSPKDSALHVCSPMLEQRPTELERVLESICDAPFMDNSISHIEEVVWSQNLIT